MKHVSIIAIPHHLMSNLFLHGKRKDNGKWALPGGHGNPGETPDETARRELKEETSLDIKGMEECRNGGFTGDDAQPFKVFLFRAPAQENLTVDPSVDPDGEFSAFSYIDPLKNNDLHVPANRNLLVHFLQDGQKIVKAERTNNNPPKKRTIFSDPWDQEKYDRGGEDEWEEYWRKASENPEFDVSELGIKKAESDSPDMDKTISGQVQETLPEHDPKHPDYQDAKRLFKPIGKHNFVKLYRSYKNTPHAPNSLLLKYAVHRIENRHKYVAAPDQRTMDKMDLDFLHLHQQGGAAEKNGAVNIRHLQHMLGANPHLIPQLLEHQRNLHDKIKTQAGWAVKDINGEPHIGLTRGLNVDRDNRERDHALASYADIKNTGFGDHMHHQMVPLKNVWYSYDVGPEEASSENHGPEDEYLVSPHNIKYTDPSDIHKLFPEKQYQKPYTKGDQEYHQLTSDPSVPWSKILEATETHPLLGSENAKTKAIMDKADHFGLGNDTDALQIMKWASSDQNRIRSLHSRLREAVIKTSHPQAFLNQLFSTGGRKSNQSHDLINDAVKRHLEMGGQFRVLPDEQREYIREAASNGKIANPGRRLLKALWNDDKSPDSRRKLIAGSNFGPLMDEAAGLLNGTGSKGVDITPEERHKMITDHIVSKPNDNWTGYLIRQYEYSPLPENKAKAPELHLLMAKASKDFGVTGQTLWSLSRNPYTTKEQWNEALSLPGAKEAWGAQVAQYGIGHPNLDLKNPIVKKLITSNHLPLEFAQKQWLTTHGGIEKSEKLEKKLIFEGDSLQPHRDVWRVQNEAGQGPYYGTDELKWHDTPHNDTRNHPPPQFDKGFDRNDISAMTDFHPVPRSVRHENPSFGFESEEHLKNWFSPVELHRLAGLGFKPVKLKARKVWSSGKQAFFLPHHEEMKKSWTGSLPGAVPQPKGPNEIPPNKLREGMAVESEHSKDPKVQAEVAVPHINEDENYYKKLRAVEGEVGPRDKLRKLIRKA